MERFFYWVIACKLAVFLFSLKNIIMNIVLISGSPRQQSVTQRVAIHLLNRLKNETDHNITYIDMREHWLPPIQQVYKNAGMVPEEQKPIAGAVFNADAFILVSPEYNGGYSATMKNFLDHFPKHSRKAFGIATASDGAMGGMRAAQQLLQLVPALFGIASPRMLVTPLVDKKFNADGSLADPAFEKSISVFLEEFLWLAAALTKN